MYECVVSADEAGNVIGVSNNNPEYGYIRIEHVSHQINNEGWFKLSKRSALIKGKVDELKQANYKAGDIILGKIIVKESLEPFNSVNPEKDLKMAGANGIVCKVGEQPIYRNTFYTPDVYTEDEFISHDNTEEIKNANVANKELAGVLLSKLSEKKDSTVTL